MVQKAVDAGEIVAFDRRAVSFDSLIVHHNT